MQRMVGVLQPMLFKSKQHTVLLNSLPSAGHRNCRACRILGSARPKVVQRGWVVLGQSHRQPLGLAGRNRLSLKQPPNQRQPLH